MTKTQFCLKFLAKQQSDTVCQMTVLANQIDRAMNVLHVFGMTLALQGSYFLHNLKMHTERMAKLTKVATEVVLKLFTISVNI